MKIKLLSSLVFLFCMCYSLPVLSQHIISPKYGYINWEKESVTVAGTTIEFEMGSYPALGFEYGYKFFDRLYVGGEFVYEDLDVTIGKGYFVSNDINAYRVMGVLDYYFLASDFFNPFVGVGIGYAKMGIHAAESATLHGYTYMGKLGFDLQFSKRLALTLEYRNAYISMDDDANNQMKSRNDEFYIGLNISFGR